MFKLCASQPLLSASRWQQVAWLSPNKMFVNEHMIIQNMKKLFRDPYFEKSLLKDLINLWQPKHIYTFKITGGSCYLLLSVVLCIIVVVIVLAVFWGLFASRNVYQQQLWVNQASCCCTTSDQQDCQLSKNAHQMSGADCFTKFINICQAEADIKGQLCFTL